MKLLMVSGDRSILQGKFGAFWYTLQELRTHWDRIDVICPRVADKEVDIHESGHLLPRKEDGCDVFFHPSPYALLRQHQWIYEKGKKLVDAWQHDVMTVHDYPPFYNGIGARRLHRDTGIPYALEIHHIVGWPHATTLIELVGRWMSHLYLAHDAQYASQVRVVNKTIEKLICGFGIPKEKIKNISSLYLDRSIVNPDLKPPVSYDVSFCGRLVSNKGLLEVIQAVAKLRDVRLLVIGDGPERQRAERLAARLGIGKRVTFLGWLPSQEAVSGALQTARIFVMNSRSEGGPRVALEAMGCGMPIITTRVGVMPEVIHDGVNGIFTTGSPNDVAEKIEMLLENEQLRTQLSYKAAKVLDRYERTSLVKQYADFLKDIAR